MEYTEAKVYGRSIAINAPEYTYVGEQIQAETFEKESYYEKALEHYKKVYQSLPPETANKEDFMEDIKRMENLLEGK